ncbi:hypothetical protein WN943_002069 [Citrus x changshan-huyou]|uniref:Uncharacterized protein n=1 Tax=Citrus unshiu TaxID=55188 RepID=A0A2H5P225_CITUN|nr:hypothetical protein CUMW_097000 [Citrus unshiu]
MENEILTTAPFCATYKKGYCGLHTRTQLPQQTSKTHTTVTPKRSRFSSILTLLCALSVNFLPLSRRGCLHTWSLDLSLCLYPSIAVAASRSPSHSQRHQSHLTQATTLTTNRFTLTTLRSYHRLSLFPVDCVFLLHAAALPWMSQNFDLPLHSPSAAVIDFWR